MKSFKILQIDMDQKFYDIIGLAAKANKVLFGSKACLNALKQNKIHLLIFENDVSEKTKKEFFYNNKNDKIPMIVTDEDSKLGNAGGRPGIKIVAVSDYNLAREALDKYSICSGGANIE